MSRIRRGIVLATLLLGSVPAVQAAIPASERTVLLAIYSQAGGASWTNNTVWNGAAGTECAWYGVTCDAGQNHVTDIFLQTNSTVGNNLVGTLPSLSALTALQSLAVAHNQLSGSIPALSGLTALRVVVVDYNQFTGSLPALTGLTALQAFFADHNQLTGPIPALTGLAALQTFFVNDNQLTGSIPALVGLSSLQAFSVSVNQLSGSLPSLSGLSALQFFNARENQLSGSLPSLSGLSALQSFDVGVNQLSGPLPSFSGLSALQYFNVGDNGLTGSVPSLSGLTALQSFYAFLNHLTGPMALPPSPSALLPGHSNVCGNQLQSTGNAAADQAWDVASGLFPVSGEPGWLACQTAVFGVQLVGTTSPPKSITITATPASGTITINSIATSGDFAQTNDCLAPLLPGMSCTINVTFTPQTIGLRVGTLTVIGSVESIPTVTAVFPLQGTGIIAPIIPTASSAIPSLSAPALAALAGLVGLLGIALARRRATRR